MDSSLRADRLDLTFSALGDPIRRAMLERLSRGEATVGQLAAPFDVSLPAISKHLKVLERAGLIERSRDAQRRPCRLRVSPLVEAQSWLDRYRRHWEASFARLDRALERMQTSSQETQGRKAHGRKR